jgi:hypothetical protein
VPLSAGAAYVFVRSGTTWSQQAYLKASNAEASDHFRLVQSRSPGRRWWSGLVEVSSATRTVGQQCTLCRSSLCLREERDDVEPAGLSQGEQRGG